MKTKSIFLWTTTILILFFFIFNNIGFYKVTPIPSPSPTVNLVEIARKLSIEDNFLDAYTNWKSILLSEPNNAEANYQVGILSVLFSPESASAYLDNAEQLGHLSLHEITVLRNSLRTARFIDIPEQQAVILGQTFAQLGEWSLAQYKFNQAIEINPNYAEAFAFLGESRFHLNQDGINDLAHALALNPQSFSANAFMGFYWQRNHQPSLALIYFNTASIINPTNTSILIDKANTLAQLGNFESALTTFQEATDIAPNNIDNWIALAEFSLKQELRVEEIGLPAAQNSIAIDAENIKAITLLGQAHLMSNQPFLAKRFFQKSLSINENYAPALFQMALYSLKIDDHQEAERYLLMAQESSQEPALSFQIEQILNKHFP